MDPEGRTEYGLPPTVTDNKAERNVVQITVFGLPATGKSTFARELAGTLDVPYLDMDRILFQDGKPLPLEEFRTEVGMFTDGPAWVVEGNYSKLRDVTWERSDVVVWLDYPLWFIYWRLARRGWRRLRGLEPPRQRRLKLFSRRNLVWTVTRKYLGNRAGYAAMLDGLNVIRFRWPQQARVERVVGGDARLQDGL